jgi:hypothetical protein
MPAFSANHNSPLKTTKQLSHQPDRLKCPKRTPTMPKLYKDKSARTASNFQQIFSFVLFGGSAVHGGPVARRYRVAPSLIFKFSSRPSGPGSALSAAFTSLVTVDG